MTCMLLAAAALLATATAAQAVAIATNVFGSFRSSDASGLLPAQGQSSPTGPISDAQAGGTYVADFGLIKLFGQKSWGANPAPGGGAGNFLNTGVTAGWTDQLTVTSPTVANGTPGTFAFNITVHGSMTTSGDGQANYILNMFVNGVQRQLSTFSFSGDAPSGDGFGTFTIDPVDIVFGEPFQISVTANIDAGGFDGEAGFAKVNLGNTILWGGLAEARDDNGVLVRDADATGASGLDYTAPVTDTIPMPASLAMLLPAAAMMSRRAPRLAATRRGALR
ncbi:MAG: hypothetical protein GC162_02760 [Planctomycetes bacterium]|nr:hypothetical protein [Planctomycetota bacterium]